jgi:acyl-[acyl-carrier-protein]-phospholipid O-acyltransferase/long-chain-fatty-acid--[acyl-carrier-protein] ligase
MKMSRSFDWHNATQFLGAMNDNIFQGLMIFSLIGMLGENQSDNITAWAGLIFVVPFLLFTAYAGVLADRFSKRNIIVMAKWAELAIMILGGLLFAFSGLLGKGAVFGLYGILFLMCAQSAFFGPCKYGIIPELVEKEKLTRANSYLQGLTYVAIICGNAASPFLTDITGRRFAIASLMCILVAAAGVFCALRIHRTPAGGKDAKASMFFLKDIWLAMQNIKHDRHLVLAIYASAYFLLIGGFAKIILIPYGIKDCGLKDTQSGYLFVIAALGIGIGSWLAGRLSGRTVEVGIIPIGAGGMALTAIGLGLKGINSQPQHGIAAVFVLVFLFGLSAGLFVVPINAFIQLRAPNDSRGRILGASNFLGWIGVAAAALTVNFICVPLGIAASWQFLAIGALTLLLSISAVAVLPDFLLRLIVVLITRLVYRIKVEGEENFPTEGPALLVSNHVSWADAVVLMATQQRRIRFVMDKSIYNNPWTRWVFRLGRMIPISAREPKQIVKALKEARKALDHGCLVCVFAEGMLTRTGMLGKFHAGFEKIVEGTTYPIIPTYLGGLWGSILSHYHGDLMSAWPRRLPCPVSVHFGKPMPADSSTRDIRWAIEELSVDFFSAKKSSRYSLGQTLIQACRRNWRKACLSDTTGKRLTFGKTLIAAAALADKIEAQTAGQKNIGIFLPSSVAGALANYAVALLNKTAVNLSYTASESDRAYMIETAEIKTVLTSPMFLEKLNIQANTLPGVILMEDLIAGITDKEKRKAFFKARFWPRKKLARLTRDFSADDTAVILFSSGSSGRPKGVQLSHHNIQSDIESALTVFKVFKSDKLCGILPFFHSFGLTCTLWLPLIAARPACFVPNPLDGKLVGETIAREKATLLFATPTFLLNYLRRCGPDDFKTLRFIVAGAEKLKPKLMDMFEEKFGIRPCEGYGATECSPLIAFNVPDVQVGGGRQIGTKEGTVGHTIPGLAVKALDIETGRPVELGQPGLLYVKGPNVMNSYLKLPEKTAEILKDGWYNTGDIVTIDEDGFVTICDRLSRFSKIGGEMVPHMTIEELAMEKLGMQESALAVTSVPDEKKGEQLVILYDKQKIDGDKLYAVLSESDLPKLYIPKRENLIGIDQIPLLGSGKLDMMKLRHLAHEYMKNKESKQ